MFFIKSILFLFLSITLFSNPLNFKYSYGLHDFTVQKSSHTLGVNAGIYAEYTPSTDTLHSGYFEIFTEHDEKEQDPDHIPIWFRANYGFETMLTGQYERFKLNAVVDFDWKMNTVSSVEQYLKSGVGLEFIFTDGTLTLAPKILSSIYYLEIDDDVPRENNFGRSDLEVGYKVAVMYGASLLWNISEDVTLGVELEEWNEKGQWLERNTFISVTYKRIEELYIIFSIEKTIYNLENFRKDNIDILPWNQDMLFKLVVRLPLEW